MSYFTINLLDGESPTKITLEKAPQDFNNLFADLRKIYPTRMENLFEAFNKQEFVIYKNYSVVTSLEESINPEDQITVLSNIIGG